ncbi:MAG: HAD-IC family P-type ATPase [Candidatus Nomurabacteria bacterium]|nr:MAG: HAD-IC family P-type ATPase [Candidatus Nomurabacteria bacterium]
MNQLINPWVKDSTQLAKELSTDQTLGLTSQKAEDRLSLYGDNIFTDDNTRGALKIFFHQFNNALIIVLLIAVALTVTLNEWADALVISFAIVVNTILGFFQEYKAERAIADLKSYILDRARVIRDGKESEVDARLLVPGDLIHITRGTRITADARIIKENGLTVDESLLTGESIPEAKSIETISETTLLADRTNMIYAGTLAVVGSAYAIVTATGNQTEIGKLAKLVATTVTEKTPLQIAMEKLTKVIVVVILAVVLLVFILGLLQEQPVIDMLLISIAIIVGAVPESLPIGLTAVLAIGVEQIAKKRGIMRSLTAAETLGSTTLIMTDKTGTLTQAKMELVDIIGQEDLVAKPIFTGTRERYSENQKELLTLALCSTDVVIEDEDLHPKDWVITGSILEKNIVQSAAMHGIRFKQKEKSEIKVVIPFSSKYKFSVNSISTHFLPKNFKNIQNPHVILGAPDVLLNHSSLDSDEHQKTSEVIEQLSQNGRRVLGIGLMSPKDTDSEITPKDVTDVTFVGVVCFYDPIRPEVLDALKKIDSYGVKVVMATGDLPGTALSVAKDLNWEVGEHSILTGSQVKQMNDEELTAALDHVKIFARVAPEDKLRITKLYQARCEIVAMTGDGVNDTPSLKAANIGIAVGSGSDVAKSTADLVLLDDNFKTIVATIEEGKRMLQNIRKIFVYLMSNSLDEVFLIGGAIIAGLAMPLSAIQIIWVNLFTGSIPSIAYAFDKQAVTKDRPNKTFFDSSVKFLTIGVGVFTSTLLFFLYVALLDFDVPLETAQNVIFACFGSYILLIAFSFRNLELPIYKYSLTENKILLLGVIGGLSLLIMTLYIPFFQNIFDTSALTLPWLLFVIVWILLNVVIVEIAKWFSYTYLKTKS